MHVGQVPISMRHTTGRDGEFQSSFDNSDDNQTCDFFSVCSLNRNHTEVPIEGKAFNQLPVKSVSRFCKNICRQYEFLALEKLPSQQS